MTRLCALIFPALLLLAACGEQQDTVVSETNTLRVGIDPNYPPFEWTDSASGRPVGFDVDLLDLLCERLGWEHEYVVRPFDHLLDSVHAGSLDLAISAISITRQRRTQVMFSDPYCLTGQTITVQSSSTDVTDLNDLRGKRVGVLAGSTAESLTKSVDNLLVFPYRSLEGAFAQLSTGDLDAVVNDAPNTRAIAEHYDNLVVLSTLLNSEYYAVALQSDAREQCRALNMELATMMGNGEFDSLYHHWFGRSAFDETW